MTTTPAPSTDELAARVRAGERRAIARAITLVESTRDDDEEHAQALLAALAPHTGHALRVGISGTPGVGKSTFLEALGLMLLARGHRVAVLAVDPSSPTTGGSILGDKTRMEDLAKDERAFIRPSPSQGALGGVARKTREASFVLEAAGYDVVLIETVGTGQSETTVASMVDTFVLLVAPGGGDELQGVKRGVLEVTDVLVVNKADGALAETAARTAAEYRQGLAFSHHTLAGYTVPVVTCSAREQTGLDDVWSAVLAHRKVLDDGAHLASKRAHQREQWMWSVVDDALSRAFRSHAGVKALLDDVTARVRQGHEPPTRAAKALVDAFLRNSSVRNSSVRSGGSP
jgi:LAO/AO transport system kinase